MLDKSGRICYNKQVAAREGDLRSEAVGTLKIEQCNQEKPLKIPHVRQKSNMHVKARRKNAHNK